MRNEEGGFMGCIKLYTEGYMGMGGEHRLLIL